MNTQRKENRIKAAVLWVLTMLCMGAIFYLSAQPAEASAEMSGGVLLWMNQFLGAGLTDFIVRKLAHLLEYGLLALLVNGAFYYTRQRRPFYLPGFIITSFYAGTDELHQLFVAGRACQLRDWAIDSTGAAAGTLAFLLLVLLYRRLRQMKKQGAPKI